MFSRQLVKNHHLREVVWDGFLFGSSFLRFVSFWISFFFSFSLHIDKTGMDDTIASKPNNRTYDKGQDETEFCSYDETPDQAEKE